MPSQTETTGQACSSIESELKKCIDVSLKVKPSGECLWLKLNQTFKEKSGGGEACDAIAQKLHECIEKNSS